jgi:hypothetical protein
MDGTRRIAAHLAKLALLIAFGDDRFTGKFAGLELGPLCVFFRGWLFGSNLGVFVAGEGCASFFLLAVRRTDLNQLWLRGDGFGDMRCYFGLVAGRVGTLCGIRATGKYFPLARRRAPA